MRSCHLQRRARCHTLHLHAPCRVLVSEGVDHHCSDGALEVSCPVSSPHVRDLALRLAASCGWTLTVDAFAFHSNALLPPFFARYAEPSAEVEDAFTVPYWACSTCPACGQLHRETLFAFPPPLSSTSLRPKPALTAPGPSSSRPCPSPPRFGTSSFGPLWYPTPMATSAYGSSSRVSAQTSTANSPSSPSISRHFALGFASRPPHPRVAASVPSGAALRLAPPPTRPNASVSTPP